MQNYAPPPQYEFNAAQNEVIAKVASRTRLAGIAQIIFGACDFFGSCHLERTDTSTSLGTTSSPFDLALIISGFLMISAAASFAKIVATQGSDMAHLMTALRSYSRANMVQFVTYMIMAALMALALLLMLVVVVFFAAFLKSLAAK
jgi:hypothetical protein